MNAANTAIMIAAAAVITRAVQVMPMNNGMRVAAGGQPGFSHPGDHGTDGQASERATMIGSRMTAAASSPKTSDPIGGCFGVAIETPLTATVNPPRLASFAMLIKVAGDSCGMSSGPAVSRRRVKTTEQDHRGQRVDGGPVFGVGRVDRDSMAGGSPL